MPPGDGEAGYAPRADAGGEWPGSPIGKNSLQVGAVDDVEASIGCGHHPADVREGTA